MRINVALDIDGVLGSCYPVQTVEEASFYLKKGAILTANGTHYIFPGVLEFVRLIFQMPDKIKVSFFSSGPKSRNLPFVQELLKLALPPLQYEEAKHQVRVLSNNDLSPVTDEQRKEHCRLYALHAGQTQKDLSKALEEGESLEDAVLIDDNTSLVACGQAKTFLHAPEAVLNAFRALPEKCELYEKEGFRFFECCLILEDDPEWEQMLIVDRQKHILIKRNGGDYEIKFLSKKGFLETRKLSAEEHADLIRELAKIPDSLKAPWINIIDTQLVAKICQAVQSFEGISTKICRSANRIFYVAGLFFTALNKAEELKLPISQVLFDMQFIQKENGTYEHAPRYNILRKRDALYHFGLQKLQEVNSELKFVTPHSYTDILHAPLSEEERSMLFVALQNRYKSQ